MNRFKNVLMQDLTPLCAVMQSRSPWRNLHSTQHYPRNEAMARAFLSGQHAMAAVAQHFRVHYSTVSRAVRDHEQAAA